MLMESAVLRSLPRITIALLLNAAGFCAARESSAFEELLAKANAGDATAQWQVAAAYDSGRWVRRDGKQAKRWYLAAAEQGYAEAQNSLGSALQAEGNLGKAREWYEKASAQNHALATNNLAYLYDLGFGVPQDRQKAFALYSRAADLGWAEAMWNISVMYGAGQKGEGPDLQNACVWTFRAQHFADGEAKVLANISHVTPMLEHKLSKEQMAACREQADAWSPNAMATASDIAK
jgi:TPR repeat protein